MSDPFADLTGGYDDDVSLTADDKKHAKTDREDWFKGEKGQTYRIALVYFHPIEVATVRAARAKAKAAGEELSREQMVEVAKAALAKRAEELGKAPDQLTDSEKLYIDKVQFKKILNHYKDGVGYVLSRLGMDGADADKIWGMMGDLKTNFTTVIIQYPTNNDGDLQKERLKDWKVWPWRIHKKTYGALIAVAEGLRLNDLSIADQDLMAKCTNKDFQNFDINGAGKALWRKHDAFRAKVLAAAVKFYDKKVLVPFREMSTADLAIKLGVNAGAGSGVADVSEDEFEGLLDNV